MEIPKKINLILKKLKKSPSELGEYCISHVADAIKGNGYSDAKLWAKTALHAIIGELGAVEDELMLEEMANQMDGFERDAMEAFFDLFTGLQEELGKVKAADLRDALVYSIMQVIDSEDKKNYRGIYG